MVAIGTILYVKLFGKFVGQDEFGNKYYLDTRLDFEGKHKRMVIYKGRDEPTKVPPLWHSWLHYTSDDIPNKEKANYKWQREHVPNLTGTRLACFPPGHPLSNSDSREKASGDYLAWKPK